MPDKMKEIIIGFENLQWDVPVSFRSMYLTEVLSQHMRCHKSQDFVAVCHLRDGALKGGFPDGRGR